LSFLKLTNLQTYIVKTFAGLEPVLAEEIKSLGASEVRLLKRAVSFEGDTRLMYRANYELRTALRVLVPLFDFQAYRERDLYEAIRSIDWNEHMAVSDTLAIDAVTQSEVFRHSQYTAQLAKDAIVDQFRDRFNRRPNVNTAAPSLRINLHINGTQCNLSLDASGDSLHKRGYRRDTVEAPINEVLAAGMLFLSGWDARGAFVDPMCGSGTIPIEAALLASGTPPQFKRDGFGFFKWKTFDEKLWRAVKKEADARIQPFEFPIVAADKESRARNAASLNAMSAGLEQALRIEKMPFEKLVPPASAGVLIANPPYDERLKVEEIELFYKSIGDRLKQQWTGWDAWLISSNRDALKRVGLRTSQKITLFNGALECSFQKFELY
jgi:putative N6-adenine-specific DNA methylase